ncbi:MAG: diguanylate cyclase response regulator [Gammaproteobacteria bacterium]|nr:diguanylate cyclase response regulator [Gammaproteobacteria bacterium]
MRSNTMQQMQLRRFFAKRVTNQVRVILGLWCQLNDGPWTTMGLDEFKHAIQTLIRFAQHFNEESHRRAARQIMQCLDLVDSDTLTPNPEVLHELTDLIGQLSHLALRRTDNEEYESANVLNPKKPVYIAMHNIEEAFKLSEQLEFFGFRVLVTTTLYEFESEMKSRRPACVIMDVAFSKDTEGLEVKDRELAGLEALKKAQAQYEHPVECIVFSEKAANIFTRLMATRTGGRFFHTSQLDVGRVVEELEELTQLMPPAPYRVLIVDDSRSQGLATQRALNQGGLITEVINDPLLIMDTIETVNPEIILLDMYMPSCMGTELAQVIRQLEEYHHIPIVFLSAEEDKEKQVSAMGFGADDFISKSEEAKYLVAEIKARGRRARELVTLMHRDSLTGLLNHTRILKHLHQEIDKALSSGTPLCFAMVDIDHFKSVNDTYGHPEGDRVIKRLAMFLKQRLRKSDFVGRYGGEEFAIVLTNTTVEDAKVFLNDIREQYSKFRYHSSKGEFTSTLSCGIAELTEQNQNFITVSADEALYDAKRGGRNRVCIARH